MNKGNLECLYDAIEEKRKNRDEHIETVTKLDKEIQYEVLEYRIESVKRVLEYIHSKQFIKNYDIDYDTLITHCCNKLNGNIDGIELELKDEK